MKKEILKKCASGNLSKEAVGKTRYCAVCVGPYARKSLAYVYIGSAFLLRIRFHQDQDNDFFVKTGS